MKLPRDIPAYLEQVASTDLAALVDFSAEVAKTQKLATVISARLALELSELDGAHHEIVTRVTAANAAVLAATTEEVRAAAKVENTDERRIETLVENARQRTEYIRRSVTELSSLCAQVRRGIVELQHDQQQLQKASEASA